MWRILFLLCLFIPTGIILRAQMVTRPPSISKISYYANTRLGFSFPIPEDWSVEIDERVVDEETNERNIDFVFQLPNKQGGFTLIIYENPEQLSLKRWLDNTFDEFRAQGSFPYDIIEERPTIHLGNAAEAIRVIGFPKEGDEPAFLTFAGNYYAAGLHVYRFLWIDRGDDVYREMMDILASIKFS